MNILWNILAIVLVLFLISMLGSYLIVQVFFVRNKEQSIDKTTVDPDTLKKDEYYYSFLEAVEGIKNLRQMKKEDLSIESFDGLKLKGYLIPAEVETDKCIMCVHGYRASGEYEFGSRINFLHNLGWNILLVDNRAHGRSEGKYIGFATLDSLDAIKWLKLLEERYSENCTVVLHGVSMGAATIMAACGMPECPKIVKGVIADCGFSSGWDESKHQLKKWIHLPTFPFLYVAAWWLKVLAHYDIRERAAKDMLPNFKGRFLVIHGDDDDFVPTSMSQVVYDAATCEDKELVLIGGAKHALAYITDKPLYERKVREFLEKV